MPRLVNGGPVAWILAVVLVACSQVPDDRTKSVIQQQSPGEEQSQDKPQTPRYGVLYGRVTTGPVPPAVGPGPTSPPGPIPGGSTVPVAVAHVGITPEGSDHVWWVVTSVDGTYAINLPPGTYLVTMRTQPGMGIAKGLPATVTITKDTPTRLDIHLDTGLR